MALPLENCVIERSMPKGYTWAKFVQCWTGDPSSGRFFEPKENPATGENMPAAWFGTLVTYDRDGGWQERDIKFSGDDALWAQLELTEKNQIALVSCEGHVATRSFDGHDGRPVVMSTVHIKTGTVRLHSLVAQSCGVPGTALPPQPQNVPESASGLVEWPEPAPSEDVLSKLDNAPF